jgi:hypothetical protein
MENSVAEVIALKLRRSDSTKEYLYAQIFAGLSSILASLCLLELWRMKRGASMFERKRKSETVMCSRI